MIKPTVDLNKWIIDLFNDINQACVSDSDYTLHLSKNDVNLLSDAWDRITNVEIN